MPGYKVRGIDLDFPFDAYDCQITYMEKVIQSLQERCNALLESPTGTGKTLSLLCATLAWRRSLGPFSTRTGPYVGQNEDIESSGIPGSQPSGRNLPTIVYASRTHSQIRQVVQELKRTSYRPKMMVLGSREQLCIHDQVRLLHGKAQTNACQHLRKRQTKHYCKHFKLVGDFIAKNPHLGSEPVDIEDLVNIGRTCGPCPYYVSREIHKDVDILFAPYNYLIDRSYRNSLKIEWCNSVLIFDEAHNLESLCADAASFDLPSTLLSACIEEAKSCVDLSIRRRDMDNSSDKRCNPDNFAILRALLLKLEKRIAEVNIESELGFTRPGPYIYELLSDLNVNSSTAKKLMGIIEEAALLLEEDASGAQSKQPQQMKASTCKLDIIGDILRIIFRDGGSSHAQYYRVHVQESKLPGRNFSRGKVRTLSWWCFNPGIAMEDFAARDVGSIILTSGTLSPMDSFAQELKLEFPIRLENPHVISSDQIWAGVVPAGPSGYSLNSSFRTRDTPQYSQDLGNAVVNFARIVPDGLLVFFPSYYLMERAVDSWKDNGNENSTTKSTTWERICKYKLPVVEPRQSSLFSASIDDYMSKLTDTSTSGAVFFAVCRGKVSEGLDFSDHAGRAVIVTGLPFATRTDPKVRLKREFLDEHARSGKEKYKVLTGEEWYDQQASRAVNQAVGRVIRHRHDYGAILFCDERFASAHRQSQISRWIQPHIKSYSKFGDVVFSLTRFFRDKVKDPSEKRERPTSFYRKCSGGGTQGPGCYLPVNSCTPPEMPLSDQRCEEVRQFKTEAKPGISSVDLQAFLPANRSVLGSQKQNVTSIPKSASPFLSSSEKKPLSTDRSSSNNLDIINLASDSPPGEKFSKEAIAYSSSKRIKLLIGEYSSDSQCKQLTQKSISDVGTAQSYGMRSGLNSIRQATLQSSGTKDIVKEKKQFVFPVSSGLLAKGTVPGQVAQGITSPSSSSQEQEAKGSAFLAQVKEKLSSTEYSEFVGYMKALKSKAMKIGTVIQSIVKLFSTEDRLPLLRRFKDYIPAKYHALYDQLISSNKGETSRS